MIVNYSWPKGWRNYIITEGIEDIGLPPFVVKRIKENLDNADPAAQTYVGNLWKAQTFNISDAGFGSPGQYYNNIKNLMYELEAFWPDSPEKEKASSGWQAIMASYEHGRASYGKIPSLAKKIMKQAGKILQAVERRGSSVMADVREVAKQIPSNFAVMYETAVGRFIQDQHIRSLLTFLNDRPDNWNLVKRYSRGVYEKYLYENWFADAIQDARTGDPDFRDPDQNVRNAAANTVRKRIKQLVKEDPYVQRIRKAKGLPDPEDDHQFREFIKYQNELAAESKNEVLRFPEEDVTGREFFWVDLKTKHCPIEASRMGHCGQSGDGRLFSLRYKPEGARLSKSVVTLEYDEDNNIIHQIKGNSNSVPSEGYWDYISSFIDEVADPYVSVVERGEHSDDDPEDWRRMGEYVTEDTHGTYDQKGNRELEQMTTNVNDGDFDTTFVKFTAEYEDQAEWNVHYAVSQVSVVVNIPFNVKIPESAFEGLPTHASRGQAVKNEINEGDIYSEAFEMALKAFTEYYEDELLGPHGTTPSNWVAEFLHRPGFYIMDSPLARAGLDSGHPKWARNLWMEFSPQYEETRHADAEELSDWCENVGGYELSEDVIEEMSKKLTYYLANFMSKIGLVPDGPLANMKDLLQRIQKLEQKHDNIIFELEEDYDWDDYEDLQLEMGVEGLELYVRIDTMLKLFKENPTHSEGWDPDAASNDLIKIARILQMYMFGEGRLGRSIYIDHIEDAAEKAEQKQTQLAFGKKHESNIEFRKPSDMSFDIGTYSQGTVRVSAKFDIGVEKTPNLTKEDVDGIIKYFEAIIKYARPATIHAVKNSMEFLRPSKATVGEQVRQLLDSAEYEFAPDWVPKQWKMKKTNLSEGRRKIKIRMRRR